MLNKQLEKLGFSPNMSTVYLALFRLGECRVSDIVKSSGLHRYIVYTELDKLVERDLASKYKKGKILHYKPLHPERLVQLIKEQEMLAEDIKEELLSIRQPQHQSIQLHEGIDALRDMYVKVFQSLDEDQSVSIIGSSKIWQQTLGKKIVNKLYRYQKKKNNAIQIIASEETQLTEEFPEQIQHLWTQKIMPNSTSDNMAIVILDNRVVLSLFVRPYSVFDIVNPEIVLSYKKYFDTLWQQETSSYTGYAAVTKLLDETFLSKPAGSLIRWFGGGYGETGDDTTVETFFIDYNKKRVAKKLITKILFSEQHKTKARREYSLAGDKQFRMTHLRFLPDAFYSPLQIGVSDDMVILLMFEDEPIATVYERKSTVEAFRKQFELLWGMAEE